MSQINPFPRDYAPAIVFPCDESNQLGPPNNPKGFVCHTPEEPADGYPATPHWFAQAHPDRAGSTHYFVAYTGDVYQMVPESSAAIANGVKGRPYPSWANPGVSLNRQSVNVEIEGYAESIQDTLVVGGAQWNALVALVRDRAARWGFQCDREHIIGHYQVADNRSDPGAGFPWDALIAALNEEDDMTERVWDGSRTWIVGKGGSSLILYPEMDKPLEAIYGPHTRAMAVADLEAIRVK